jgi:hypothetical protein
VQSSAIKCNQVQSSSIKSNQVQSRAIMFNQGRAHQSSVIKCNPVQSSAQSSAIKCNQVQSSAIKATLTKCWLSSPNWSPNTALTHGLMPPEPRAMRARPTKRPARASAHSAAIRRNQRLSAPIGRNQRPSVATGRNQLRVHLATITGARFVDCESEVPSAVHERQVHDRAVLAEHRLGQQRSAERGQVHGTGE